MPRNIFEELVITQQKEELARIKILSRIKSGDIKGAHRIAKPYLEKIAQRSPNEPIPTGWLAISKTLCAVDICKHGTINTHNSNAITSPKEDSWLHTALEIISNRAKGFIKALVPATLAIALIAQALQILNPTTAEAVVTPNSEDPHNTIANTVITKELEQEKGDTDLSWEVIDQGIDPLPKTLNDRLRGKVHLTNPNHAQSIKWSIGSVTRNDSTKLINAELIAQNISDSTVAISEFSMTDSRYEGCTLRPNNNKLEALIENSAENLFNNNSQNSPSEIPKATSAIYKVTIAKSKSPQIIFRTGNGEIHTMKLNLNGLDKLSNPLERKSWAKYKLSNNGKNPLEITIKNFEGVNVTNLKISEGERELNIDSPKEKLILKTNQNATLLVEAKEKYSPDIELLSKSPENIRNYKLQTTAVNKLMGTINRTYDSLVYLVFNDNKKNLDWQEVQNRCDALLSMFTPQNNPKPETKAIINKLSNGCLVEEVTPLLSQKNTRLPSHKYKEQVLIPN